MWLRYGIDKNNNLVPVEDVPSGKTSLKCPYCNGALTAKKGRRKEHHLAHSGETCREVQRGSSLLPNLPLYDNFNIWLTANEFKKLTKLWNRYEAKDRTIPEKEVPKIFVQEKLLEFNRYMGGYQFTKLGKVPFGALSLNLFNQVQEPLLSQKLQQLEKNVQNAYSSNSPLFNEALRDLQIYRAEYRKILQNTLYYLEIDVGETTIYKIGVTGRDLSFRLAEIERDLRSHFPTVSIKVLGEWTHRGNVEKYFLYKYNLYVKNFSVTVLGTWAHTEYLIFFNPEESKAVLRDLRRMQPKNLSKIEQDILAGEPSQIQQWIAHKEHSKLRSQAIKTGMSRAKHWRQNIGRPAGSESPEVFLAKKSSQKVIAALGEGLSLRDTAKIAGVAVNTVRKVKILLETKYKNS